MAGRGEAVKVDQRDPVYDRVADLDNSCKATEGVLVDLVPGQQFGS